MAGVRGSSARLPGCQARPIGRNRLLGRSFRRAVRTINGHCATWPSARRTCAGLVGGYRVTMNRSLSATDPLLVAGAGGFIGGWLVRYLHEIGFTTIRAVDVKPL